MTPSELKYQVERHNTESKFFSRENMKFAKDTMSNFGVRSALIHINPEGAGPEACEVWELYRKSAERWGVDGTVAHFRKDTFGRVFKVTP